MGRGEDCAKPSSDKCVAGCSCPEGTMFDGQSCIAEEDCPCVYNGKIYENYEIFQLPYGCGRCMCHSGEPICHKKACRACRSNELAIEAIEGECCHRCVPVVVVKTTTSPVIGTTTEEGKTTTTTAPVVVETTTGATPPMNATTTTPAFVQTTTEKQPEATTPTVPTGFTTRPYETTTAGDEICSDD